MAGHVSVSTVGFDSALEQKRDRYVEKVLGDQSEFNEEEWRDKLRDALSDVGAVKRKVLFDLLDRLLVERSSKGFGEFRKGWRHDSDFSYRLASWVSAVEDCFWALEHPTTRAQLINSWNDSFRNGLAARDGALKDLVAKLKRFADDRDVEIVVSSQWDGIDYEDEEYYGFDRPTVMVRLPFRRKGTDQPGMTIFVREGVKLEIDDVLDFGDRDFFDNDEQSVVYFDLIEYLRTGRLNPVGTVKLYRQMSDVEYEKWEGGEKIPKGKFFASNQSQASGMDVAGKFDDVYSFVVDAECVRQTDHGVYQTVRVSRMVGGKIKRV